MTAVIAGVAPHVLIDPEDAHALQAGEVVDQDPLAFGQDGVVGGVPCHGQVLSDPGHVQVLTNDRLQRPRQPTAGQLRPWFRGLGHCLGATCPQPTHR